MSQVLLWCSLAVLLYIYAGYPALLKVLVRVRARPIRKRDITPSVSLIISAHNEAAVIRGKLENALRLDYPPGLLEIVVVSDASSDQTDEIVREYGSRGVVLNARPLRRGKTAGLNAVVPKVSGEIVVFSDANALYEQDAVRKLVRNFADPEVGCVTGEARYIEGNRSAADAGERVYWNYEIQLKRLETAIASMVGGDGAIYAIRKQLWQELPENAINDFLNPLQIVAAGWRGVYEPEAVCHEETAGGMHQEYRRRVRIVSRSWQAVAQLPGLLNPFRSGFFALALFSHKVLRWLSGVFFALAAVGLGLNTSTTQGSAWGIFGVASLAIVGWLASRRARRLMAFVVYFSTISAASVVGVFNGVTGRVSGVWSTAREGTDGAAGPARIRRLIFASILALACAPAVAILIFARGVPDEIPRYTFWISVAILGYIYLGYPATLSFAGLMLRRPVRHEAVNPSVCLLITANDEEDVIAAKLQNTLKVDYPRALFEIVVASDGSVDATNNIVRSFAAQGVKLVEFRKRQGKIAAINRTVPLLTSDIIVFSDANTFLASGAIKALVRNFGDPRVGAVSGDVVLLGDRASLGRSEDLYYRYERWLQRAESAIGSMVGVDGALYAIRRHLFVSPPEDTVLDDMAIPMAVACAGSRVVFESDALAYEQGPRTAIEEFRRRVRISAGGMQYLIRADSVLPRTGIQMRFGLIVHKALRWMTFSFAILAFVSAIRLSPISGFFFAFVLGHAGLLLIGVAGCNPVLRQWRLVGLVHYFCLVQSATAFGLVRGLRNRQPVAWERFARAQVKST